MRTAHLGSAVFRYVSSIIATCRPNFCSVPSIGYRDRCFLSLETLQLYSHETSYVARTVAAHVEPHDPPQLYVHT
jgi:hypothetical protein